jgi:hypothetical protein
VYTKRLPCGLQTLHKNGMCCLCAQTTCAASIQRNIKADKAIFRNKDHHGLRLRRNGGSGHGGKSKKYNGPCSCGALGIVDYTDVLVPLEMPVGRT